LALGRLASAGTTVVGAVLAILRGRGQVVDHVSGIPDLVGVTVVAAPYLNLRSARYEFKMVWKHEWNAYAIAIGLVTIGEVKALAFVRPFQAVITLRWNREISQQPRQKSKRAERKKKGAQCNPTSGSGYLSNKSKSAASSH